ncbi:T9SS type A sorting domain-containing protein [Polaribacter sp.]|nr:T9SS type A sorting domain-containing protein [Polaribacter sp.]
MRKITLLFILSIAFSSLAQEKLTSSELQYLRMGSWVFNSRTDYTYNTSNKVIQQDFYADYNSDDVPELQEVSTYTYNSSGNITQEIFQTRNDSDVLENSYRNDYSYNSDNLPIEAIFYEWENDTWVRDGRIVITLNGVQIDNFISYTWDGSDFVLENEESGRSTYSYSGDKIASILYEDYVDDAWVVDGKDEFTYDSAGNLIKEDFLSFENGTYISTQYAEYAYDDNNNIINSQWFYDENEDGNITAQDPETYFYDTTKNMADIINPVGENYGITIFPDASTSFVNKILRSEEGDDYRTLYSYDGATANTNDFIDIAVSIYPNPTTDMIHISSTDNFEIDNIKVFNTIGKQIAIFNTASFSIKNLSDGIYFLNISTKNNGVVTKKIAKN